MKIAIVLNRAGGTLRSLDADTVAEDCLREFVDAGHDAETRVVAPEDVEAAIKAVSDDGGTDALVVGGGDGTVSAAAAALAGGDTALGVLPLGTLNLFARSLGIPIGLEPAVRALACGTVRSVDLGEVNGTRFVNHVSHGPNPRVIRLREVGGYSSRLGKLAGDVAAWLRVTRRPRPLRIDASAGEHYVRREVSMAVVANNPFGEGFGHLPHSDDPAAGTLALYLSGSLTRGELLTMSAAAMLGQWRENPLLDMVTATEIEIRTSARRIVASVDGELVRFRPPLTYRCLKGALSVLVPTDHAAPQG